MVASYIRMRRDEVAKEFDSAALERLVLGPLFLFPEPDSVDAE